MGNHAKGGRTKPKPKSRKAKVTRKMGSKRRTSRMGKEMKRGQKGILASYLTRSQVIRRLQLTLKDFRRLCILKGIYPRDPKKKASGKDKTYYHIKDISFLSHEPLLDNFRAFKAFLKKVRRSAGRGETSEARRRHENARPAYHLDHLVKERYPRFVDALRDLDDALSLVHLFAALPQVRIETSHRVEACRRLSREWQLYVARAGCLSKVFVSIKGVYCQAVVQGLPVTWVQPHQFTVRYPQDVDFRIMLTFLEFYEVLLKFVLFRLYNLEGLRYPPLLDDGLDAKDAGLLALRVQGIDDIAAAGAAGAAVAGADKAASAATMAVAAASAAAKAAASGAGVPAEVAAAVARQQAESERRIKSLEKRLGQISTHDAKAVAAAAADNGDDADGEMGAALMGPLEEAFMAQTGGSKNDKWVGDGDDGSNGIAKSAAAAADEEEGAEAHRRRLFRGLRFFLAREVPRSYMTFMIAAFSGQVGWEGEGSPFQEEDGGITHQVVDRPALRGSRRPRREYVQPQWVFDSINARTWLPVERYAVGASLPPHLSPFVDDTEEGYVPAYREELQRMAAAGGSGDGGDGDDGAPLALVAASDAAGEAAVAAAMEDDDEAAHAHELQQEAAGVSFSEASASRKRKASKRGPAAAAAAAATAAAAAADDDGVEGAEEASSAERDDDQEECGEEEKASGEEGDGSGDDDGSGSEGSSDDGSDDDYDGDFDDGAGTTNAASAAAAAGSATVVAKRVTFAQAARTEAEEERELSRVMMSKKAGRLYQRMQHGIGKKNEKVERLKAKRRETEKKYADLVPPKSKKQKKQPRGGGGGSKQK